MTDGCYVCASPDLAEGTDLRNPTCAAHVGAHRHVVSMRNAPATGDHLALCRCGWSAQQPRTLEGYQEIDALVKAHWRLICGEPA